MNVLIIGDSDYKYGASRSLIQMAANLNLKPDINVTVILNHESDMVETLKKNGCKVIIIRFDTFMQPYPEHFWWFPVRYVYRGLKYYYYTRILALKELEEKIKINEIDLIHSNSSREDFSSIIAKKYNIPLARHIREFGDRDYKCFSLRNDYINYMNKTAKVFIAVSDAVKEHWIRKGLDKKKIVRIYNGVKIQDSPKIQDAPLNNKNEIKLVMTGSIQETKGQIQAVKLMVLLKRESKRCSLDLIGEGGRQYIKQIKALISASGLDNTVRFLGYRNDVFDLLPNYDIGLICSKDEGFGRITAEYMMAGLPVLASNTGANSELIREGVDGYLYSYGNIEDMKEKLMRIIDHNLGGDNTHKYAVNNFSAKVNAENVYQVYKKVLGEN